MTNYLTLSYKNLSAVKIYSCIQHLENKMSIFYKSQRVGKNGKEFLMYKFRTLEYGSDLDSFAQNYTKFGKFLRKWKIDELPQLFNILKREMNFIGPRPEEQRTIDLIPEESKQILLSVRPGLTSLSSIYFFDEEELLLTSKDPAKTYWEQIKPMKILLDIFYIQNRSFLLRCFIIWQTIKKVIFR